MAAVIGLTRDDVTALFALVPLVLLQLTNQNDYAKSYRYDSERKKHDIVGAPPSYVFGIVWTLIYGLIIASAFIFFRNFEGTHYYTTIAILFLVNIWLNKWWSVVFFRRTVQGTRYALLIIIVLVLSGAVILVLLALEQAWVPFGLYAPYVLWLLYATYLNVQWLGVRKQSAVLPETQSPQKPQQKSHYTSHIPRFTVK